MVIQDFLFIYQSVFAIIHLGENMKRIGLLIAVEINAILNSNYQLLKEENVGNFKVYKYEIKGCEIIAIKSGMGQVRAAAATEILITKYEVEAIINFGVVGSLRDNLNLEMVCLVKGLVDYQFDVSKIDNVEPARHENSPSIVIEPNRRLLDLASKLYPKLPLVICASGHRFVDGKEEKEEIASKFNCDIVEMEAIGIQLVADMHNIPTLYIKGISDSFTGGAHQYSELRDTSASICFDVVLNLIDEL